MATSLLLPTELGVTGALPEAGREKYRPALRSALVEGYGISPGSMLQKFYSRKERLRDLGLSSSTQPPLLGKKFYSGEAGQGCEDPQSLSPQLTQRAEIFKSREAS